MIMMEGIISVTLFYFLASLLPHLFNFDRAGGQLPVFIEHVFLVLSKVLKLFQAELAAQFGENGAFSFTPVQVFTGVVLRPEGAFFFLVLELRNRLIHGFLFIVHVNFAGGSFVDATAQTILQASIILLSHVNRKS